MYIIFVKKSFLIEMCSLSTTNGFDDTLLFIDFTLVNLKTFYKFNMFRFNMVAMNLYT